MDSRDRIDAFGAISMTVFAVMFGYNQVVIKVVNAGLQPVFSAALRSVGAVILLSLIFWLLKRPMRVPPGSVPGLVFIGVAFSVEFILLFVALDLTTVGRASVIFYSMPVWMAVGAHFLIPGDRLSSLRFLGLLLAMAGVGWAILDRPEQGEASLVGDICALLGAMFWAGLGLGAKATRAREATPEVQLMSQLVLSSVLLMVASLFFGPYIREPDIMTWAGMGFQIIVVACAGFLFWLWILSKYPASSIASFSFLSPIFGVIMGWAFLDEVLSPGIFGSLGLVAVGLVLINRR